jgi:hypothetical protein
VRLCIRKALGGKGSVQYRSKEKRHLAQAPCFSALNHF